MIVSLAISAMSHINDLWLHIRWRSHISTGSRSFFCESVQPMPAIFLPLILVVLIMIFKGRAVMNILGTILFLELLLGLGLDMFVTNTLRRTFPPRKSWIVVSMFNSSYTYTCSWSFLGRHIHLLHHFQYSAIDIIHFLNVITPSYYYIRRDWNWSHGPFQ